MTNKAIGSKAIARTITLLVLYEASKGDLLKDVTATEIADLIDVQGSYTGRMHKVRDALQLIAYTRDEVSRLVEKFQDR